MILTLPFATCAISISDITTETKTRRVFRIKSGEKKSQGPKWESRENVGKKGFIPFFFWKEAMIFNFIYKINIS